MDTTTICASGMETTGIPTGTRACIVFAVSVAITTLDAWATNLTEDLLVEELQWL